MKTELKVLAKEIAKQIAKEEGLIFKSDLAIQLGSKTYTARQLEKRIDSQELEILQNLPPEMMAPMALAIKEGKTISLASMVFDVLKSRAKDKALEEIVATAPIEGQLGYSYRDHFKVHDVITGEIAIFNNHIQYVAELSPDAWDEWVKTLDKVHRQEIIQTTMWARIEYNPFDPSPITQTNVNNQIVSQYNAHSFPEWRKEKITNPKLPDLFKEFMETFFPHKESREYALSWMHFMLVDRNECHLLLHGRKGVGKNTFALICEKLVGSLNYKLIDPKFWDSRFNGELKYKRLCYFDEHDITEENLGQLKAYANPYISIEEKGKRVERNYKNFSSFIIANNNPQGNKLETDDRRFSVPIISTERLDQLWDKEKLDQLYDLAENDESFIGNIGWWLIENGAKYGYDNLKPLKTDLFYELVEASMAEWQRRLLELLQSGEHDKVKIDELGILLNMSNPPGSAKVTRFLENTTDRYRDYYASIHKNNKEGRYLVPNPKYLKNSKKEEETEELDVEDMDF